MNLHFFPARGQMTLEQKFKFLREWAEDLTDTHRSLQIEIHSLLGKLLRIDANLSDAAIKSQRARAVARGVDEVTVLVAHFGC
jgi:DNA-binding transcriptional regulator YbjK